MFEFSCRVRSMQRLMVDALAESKSPAVRARLSELNAVAVRYYAQLLHLRPEEAETSPDPLFMFTAVIGMCEFFAAAQAMILPLAPKQIDAKELAHRYELFIRKLVLDGLRSRVEPAGKIKSDA
jgi:hypothetical protein